MTTTQQPRCITSRAFYRALVDAGVVRDDESIRRIVIDAGADNVVLMYVERYGDERLLNVATTLDGIEISQTPAAPASKEDEPCQPAP